MFGNQVNSGPDDDFEEEESELNLSDDENESEEEESEEEEEIDRGDVVVGKGTDGDENEEEEESEENEESESEEESEEEEDEIDPEILAEISGEGTTMVPVARLNQVLEENKKLKGGKQEADPEPEEIPVFDLKAKLKERNSKLLEGDEEAALAIDLEIEANREAAATQKAVNAIAQDQAQRTNAKAISEVQAKYPQLVEGDDFDPDALAEVVALRNVYLNKGDNLKTALFKAAEKVLGAATEKPAKPPVKKEEVVDPSKANRILARAKLAKRQPPTPTAKLGAPNRNSSTISTSGLDLAKMSDDEYDALPEAQKRQMRGD